MLHQNPKGSEVISLSYDPSATTKNRTLCLARGTTQDLVINEAETPLH